MVHLASMSASYCATVTQSERGERGMEKERQRERALGRYWGCFSLTGFKVSQQLIKISSYSRFHVLHLRLIQVVILLPPHDSWFRLQQTPATQSAGDGGYRKWMDGWTDECMGTSVDPVLKRTEWVQALDLNDTCPHIMKGLLVPIPASTEQVLVKVNKVHEIRLLRSILGYHVWLLLFIFPLFILSLN